MSRAALPAPELHRPVPPDRLGTAEARHVVEASEAERAAVAVRLGIPAVRHLICRFALRRHGERIEAEGALRATVVRECVVSLEPFEATVEEDFHLRFVPPGSEDDDDPESVDQVPFDGNAIDLGEAAVEQLALALDPYPRAPGAALPEPDAPEPVPCPLAGIARPRSGG